jgi:uncharacterized protein (TIGR03067 family)
MIRLIACVAILGLVAADDAKKELDKFGGTWKYTSMNVEGVDAPADEFKSVTVVIEGDHFVVKDPQSESTGTFKVDPSKNPKTMDVHFDTGPEKGNTFLGIYEFVDGKLRVCLNLRVKPRPTEFAAKPGSGRVLETLERQKP